MGNEESSAVVAYVCVFILFSLITLRFTMVKYEYLVIGSEIIIHEAFLGKRIRTEKIPMNTIKAIGNGKKINETMKYGFFANRCATIRGSLFKNVTVIYREKEKLRKLKFEPSEQMVDYLRVRLSGKYYEH